MVYCFKSSFITLGVFYICCASWYLVCVGSAAPVLGVANNRCPAATSTDDDDSNNESSAGGWWTQYEGVCYKWFNASKLWFPAEAACRSHGGHLAAIRTDQENRLVGRLSGCRDAWIGRFSADFHRPNEPEAYEWTDGQGGTGSGYSRHNFSQLADPHMGAVRASGMAWFNSHYHERYPYVCAVPAQSSQAAQDKDERVHGGCSPPFVPFNANCYWLSDINGSFVEASLHCERQQPAAHLASVHSHAELAFIRTLDLETDNCEMATVWIGLIKQTPCSPQQPGACFQWTDISGEHAGPVPEWAPGHPIADNWTVNCVSLTAGALLRSEKCHVRQRFLCKTAAAGGQ